MFKEEFINNLDKKPSFKERRIINWAFRYLGNEKAPEYLITKLAIKKEEKKVQVKNQKDEVK